MGRNSYEDHRDAVDLPGTTIGTETRWCDATAIVSVTGDIDMQSATHLTDAIGNALAQAPAGLIVDLAGVEFLASAGMTVLLSTNSKLGPGMRFAVVADGPGTSRPLRLMGVDAAVRVYPTLADALKDFAEASREDPSVCP